MTLKYSTTQLLLNVLAAFVSIPAECSFPLTFTVAKFLPNIIHRRNDVLILKKALALRVDGWALIRPTAYPGFCPRGWFHSTTSQVLLCSQSGFKTLLAFKQFSSNKYHLGAQTLFFV